MRIYDIDPATGEFIGMRDARLDPLESAAQGTEVYLLPSGAVTEAPPEAQEGYARVWSGSAWSQAVDHRGQRFWTAAEGLATQGALGDLPAGATLVEGEDPVLHWSGSAWMLEADRTDAERAAGISLSRASFFARWSDAVALQSGEPGVTAWTIAQLEASSLNASEKSRYVERVETATVFPRIDPEFGDCMTTLGAVFGLTSAEVDDLFLGEPVSIDRADCPIATPVVSVAGGLAALEARVAALEGAS